MHKRNYARGDAKRELTNLVEVVRDVKPTALIGLSGIGRSFTQQVLLFVLDAGTESAQVLEELARHCERPIVFALSNPTSNTECTATEVGLVAPVPGHFEPSPLGVRVDGRTVHLRFGLALRTCHAPGQTLLPGSGRAQISVDGSLSRTLPGNNLYIFPGLGFGAVIAKAKRVSDGMLHVAAKVLAGCVGCVL